MMKSMTVLYWIGIDPGRSIGYAVWDTMQKKMIKLQTYHQQFNKFRVALEGINAANPGAIMVVLEDTTMKKHIWDHPNRPVPTDPQEVRQALKLARNVGMNQGSCLEIKHLLDYLEIPYVPVPPGSSQTKVSVQFFQRATGWYSKSSEHSRDAGMLVVGRGA